MAYDPEVNTPSAEIIKKHFNSSASVFKIPNNIEPELKYIVPNKSLFQNIFHTITNHPDILSNIPVVEANNYALLSISMDTVDSMGFPTQNLKDAGYQYRVRGNITDSYQTSFSQFDAAIKSRSKNMGSDRIEIETKNGQLSQHAVDNSLNILEKSHSPEPLPNVFCETSDADLRVDALCMTSRLNYYFDLKIEDGVVARYHACADANTFITPDGSIRTGGDLESEFEIINFISSTHLEEKEIKEKISIAQDKLEKILESNYGDEIYKSDGSKLARAAKSIIDHYSSHNHHLQLREVGENINKYKPTQWPLTLGVSAGDLLTERAFNRLHEFKQAMPQAKDLIKDISGELSLQHVKNIA